MRCDATPSITPLDTRDGAMGFPKCARKTKKKKTLVLPALLCFSDDDDDDDHCANSVGVTDE